MAVRFVAYPRGDVVFEEFVRAELATRVTASSREAESRIRRVYPRAAVRERDRFAAYEVDPLWYVYRDGRPSRRDEAEWWTESGTAEATFADGGVYQWANDEFCTLHGLPSGGVIGRRWDEFATSESISEADALWRELVSNGALARGEPIESTFTLNTPDGLRAVEYRTAVDAEGTFRTWMRPIDEV
jgi:PAS domain-containing protein